MESCFNEFWFVPHGKRNIDRPIPNFNKIVPGVRPANSPSVILSTDGKTDIDFACPRKSIIIKCVECLAVRVFFAGKGPVKSSSLGVYHLAENL